MKYIFIIRFNTHTLNKYKKVEPWGRIMAVVSAEVWCGKIS
jgi:hypothetical protein